MRTRIALLLGIVLVAGACAGPGGGGAGSPSVAPKTFAAGSSMAAIVAKGKLVCGVKFDVIAFGFKNPTTGEIEGLDADLCRELAKELGVSAELTEAVSKNRIPFLKEDKVDLIISTFTANEERRKEVDFSHVYYKAGQSILVKKESTVQKVEDLVGKKVCTGEGSTSEKNLRAKGVTDLLLFQTYTEGAQALVDGRCEAVSTDDSILFGLAKQFPGTELRGTLFSDEPLAIGIKKGRTDLVEFVNGVLEAMKADGRLKALYDKHIKPFTGKDVEVPF
ncbi:MAG TPA: glutamate ABC transporter substrate-binding protein [Candidatus Limnocylindrales bacterium]|nr:glutamate ABC transporter substrate-binding protein [Candidatus Limnocylindrales bacterium]